MPEINKYVIVDADGNSDDAVYDTLQEAIEAIVTDEPMAVEEHTYVWDDSELAWTSTGDTEWPPHDEDGE